MRYSKAVRTTNYQEVRVLRDGKIQRIHVDELLVGDVVDVGVGDEIPGI